MVKMRKLFIATTLLALSLTACTASPTSTQDYLDSVTPYFSKNVTEELLLEVGNSVCEMVDEDANSAVLALAYSDLTDEQAVQILFGALNYLCPDVGDKYR